MTYIGQTYTVYLNEDGFPDLIVGNVNGPPYVYLNHCANDVAWVGIKLRSSKSTRRIRSGFTDFSP